MLYVGDVHYALLLRLFKYYHMIAVVEALIRLVHDKWQQKSISKLKVANYTAQLTLQALSIK